METVKTILRQLGEYKRASIITPLLTALLIPRYVSVFTAALGLMAVKLYLFFREVLLLKRR